MQNEPELISLLRRLLLEIVSYGDDLVIEYRALTASMTITIQAHGVDTPRLIGERGANYRALAELLGAIGTKAGYRVKLCAIREPVQRQLARTPFEARADWPKMRVLELLKDVLAAIFDGSPEIFEDEDPGSGILTLEAMLPYTEAHELVGRLREPVWRIFDAIGRNHGKQLAVDLLRSTDPNQPDQADGRHAKEGNTHQRPTAR